MFEGSNKLEFTTNHTIIFRVGFQYLLDMFQSDIKDLVLFITLFSGDRLIGVVQFPLYDAKLKLLNIGTSTVPLYALENDGTQGQALNKEIVFNVREEPLRLDDVEETPKYLKPEKEKEPAIKISK